jgi:hypothetical protein
MLISRSRIYLAIFEVFNARRWWIEENTCFLHKGGRIGVLTSDLCGDDVLDHVERKPAAVSLQCYLGWGVAVAGLYGKRE